jgi:exonuclease III
LKIVTWNCNGAFRKKYHALEGFDADLLVIQECEDPSQTNSKYSAWANNYLWVGGNKNKGLGVFAREEVTLTPLDWPHDGLRQFLPCRINDTFNLLAVWTMQANSPTFQYVGQLWKYLQVNKERMSDSEMVVCGDFNSNVIWDKWDRWWNHSDVVRELNELNIQSMYHELSGEAQGKETAPTLFLHRKKERPYHIDYAFASKALLEGGSIAVGEPDQWLELSDHMPVFFRIAEKLT